MDGPKLRCHADVMFIAANQAVPLGLLISRHDDHLDHPAPSRRHCALPPPADYTCDDLGSTKLTSWRRPGLCSFLLYK
jgi:hypothetical protein